MSEFLTVFKVQIFEFEIQSKKSWAWKFRWDIYTLFEYWKSFKKLQIKYIWIFAPKTYDCNFDHFGAKVQILNFLIFAWQW